MHLRLLNAFSFNAPLNDATSIERPSYFSGNRVRMAKGIHLVSLIVD